MKNIFKGLPESIRQTVSVVIPLLFIIILFLAVGNFGVSKVLGIRDQISSAQNTEKALTQKLNLLQTLSSEVSLKSNIVSSVVPDTNPSLTVISQLKTLAVGYGVVVSAFKSAGGSGSSSDINQATVTFNIDGARAQVFSFLTDIAKIAPITVVDKIKISEIAGNMSGDIEVKSFWVDFPKTIPSVTSPVTDLTAEERAILNNASSLIQPAFTELTPMQGGINPNPFGP